MPGGQVVVRQPAGVWPAGVRPPVHVLWGIRAGSEEQERVLPVRGSQRGGVQEVQILARVLVLTFIYNESIMKAL